MSRPPYDALRENSCLSQQTCRSTLRKRGQKGRGVFVDTELLRCGAEFSRSAGSIAQQGAERFASAELPAKVFGDFPEADDFHRALRQAHHRHVTTMQAHPETLNALAEKAHQAATTFQKHDEQSSSTLHAAGRDFT